MFLPTASDRPQRMMESAEMSHVVNRIWKEILRMDAYKQITHTPFTELSIIAQYYGFPLQSRQCMEEMGELAQALNHYYRCMNSLCVEEIDKARISLIDELSDVQIMLWQIECLLCIDLADCIADKVHHAYADLPCDGGDAE